MMLSSELIGENSCQKSVLYPRIEVGGGCGRFGFESGNSNSLSELKLLMEKFDFVFVPTPYGSVDPNLCIIGFRQIN